jgi:hypothetical protein
MTDLPLVFDTKEEREARHPVANSTIVGVGAGVATLAVTGLWLPTAVVALVGGGLGYLLTGRERAANEAEAAE